MRFSERIGKKKVKCEIQVDSMDDDLRNSLWNMLVVHVFDHVSVMHSGSIGDDWIDFFDRMWIDFFKRPRDNLIYGKKWFVTRIKEWWFVESDYLAKYDFIEYIGHTKGPHNQEGFVNDCNLILERELSAYRFVDNELSPITDKVEIAEIEEAIERAAKHKFKGVRTHLESALAKLSDRKEPDYRNSIKESISAVESLCIIISKDPKASLGKALKLIEYAVGLHPALKSGFSSIYGYTSDEGGIRHAMIGDNPCDFDDAKYMLVSCSAFLNYLIMKASKAGLIK